MTLMIPETPAAPEYGVVPLLLVERERDQVRSNEDGAGHRTRPIYILHRNGTPVILGSGRYATVVLAVATYDVHEASEFLAVKFLKHEPDSAVFSLQARRRFLEEIDKTKRFRIENEGTFVKYYGWGRFGKSRSDDQVVVDDLSALAAEMECAKRLEDENSKSLEQLDASFVDRLQGEFFAMRAELGTLDDLLVYEHDWFTRPLIQSSEVYRNALDGLVARRKGRIGQFFRYVAQRAASEGIDLPVLPERLSGQSILDFIGKGHRQMRDHIVFQVFTELVACVEAVHGSGRGERRDENGLLLAHRDLKPGNFLVHIALPDFESMSVLLSDLGFVHGVREDAIGLSTMGHSTRDPGALAPGTYAFRAPEQARAVDELHFTIDPHDAEQRRILPLAQGGVEAEVGDWFESDELQASDPTQQTFRSRIVRIDESGQGWTLEAPARAKQEALYFHGYVVRPTSQHSDVFALGAILYSIATGGRNAEVFFTKVIERSRVDFEEVEMDYLTPVYGSCFGLALALCLVEDRHRLALDMLASGVHRAHLDTIEAVDPELASTMRRIQGQNGDVVPDLRAACPIDRGLIGWIRMDRNGEVSADVRQEAERIAKRKDKLRRYVESLRQNPTVHCYMRDANGEALSFPLVYLMIRCMLRDLPDSFVRRGDVTTQSYQDVICEADVGDLPANRIRAALDELKTCPSVKRPVAESSIGGIGDPRESYEYWSGIGENPLAFLFSLRMCAAALREEGLDDEPLEPPDDDTSTNARDEPPDVPDLDDLTQSPFDEEMTR